MVVSCETSRYLWPSVVLSSYFRPHRLQLLRKEVIQPHVPVRLPCYDFIPIADPTFGSFLPEGLDH